MSLNMLESVRATSTPGYSQIPTTGSSAATKDNFLQLLVAQIKNQNPLNPADGTQFLTQLSQFTEMEQMMTIREDLQAIRKGLESAQKTSES